MFKYILLTICFFGLAACGGGGGGGASGGSGGGSSGPAKNAYRIVVTGDNVQFNSNSFDLDTGYSDHSQYTIVPTTIPAGNQFEVDFSEYNLQNLVIQVDNMNGTPSMTAKLYRNGTVVEQTTLFTNGTFHNFSNW